MKIKKLRLRLNLAIDFVYCLNLNLYTDIPRSEWVQQNKDMVSKGVEKWCYITNTISKVTIHRNSALC